MEKTQGVLKRLGWPVEEMSDRQITQELYRRWFAVSPGDTKEESPLSVASAGGIIASMCSEGNLDALCWSPEDRIPEQDVVPDEDEALYLQGVSESDYHPDRRRSRREPARDLVRWCLSGGEVSVGCTGWLINRSVEGMAFVAPTSEAPQAGEEIVPEIHSRTNGVLEVGPATVVRTEMLNEELTLVCARLIEQTWPQ
jgi:hypothetical protein